MDVIFSAQLARLRRTIPAATLFLLLTPKLYAQETAVTVHADPRLAILLKKHRAYVAEAEAPPPAVPSDLPTTSKPPAVVYSGAGFRVQIYNGPDRNKALRIKTEFMRRYPGVHSYISYSAPSFRIKVGDFKTHGEAATFQNEVSDQYKPTMVVPDNVTIMSY
jgi:hypothetical protein